MNAPDQGLSLLILVHILKSHIKKHGATKRIAISALSNEFSTTLFNYEKAFHIPPHETVLKVPAFAKLVNSSDLNKIVRVDRKHGGHLLILAPTEQIESTLIDIAVSSSMEYGERILEILCELKREFHSVERVEDVADRVQSERVGKKVEEKDFLNKGKRTEEKITDEKITDEKITDEKSDERKIEKESKATVVASSQTKTRSIGRNKPLKQQRRVGRSRRSDKSGDVVTIGEDVITINEDVVSKKEDSLITKDPARKGSSEISKSRNQQEQERREATGEVEGNKIDNSQINEGARSGDRGCGNQESDVRARGKDPAAESSKSQMSIIELSDRKEDECEEKWQETDGKEEQSGMEVHTDESKSDPQKTTLDSQQKDSGIRRKGSDLQQDHDLCHDQPQVAIDPWLKEEEGEKHSTNYDNPFKETHNDEPLYEVPAAKDYDADVDLPNDSSDSELASPDIEPLEKLSPDNKQEDEYNDTYTYKGITSHSGRKRSQDTIIVSDQATKKLKTEKETVVFKQNLSATNASKSNPTSAQTYKRFQTIALNLIRSIEAHRFSSPFLTAVTTNDYNSVVKQPHDLKTILKNVKKKHNSAVYTTVKHLERDIMLMFANCVMYNKSSTPLSKMAKEMRDEVRITFSMFEDAESGNLK